MKGVNQNPQSMDELLANYTFEHPIPMFTWDEYCVKRDEIQRERAMARIRKYRTTELTQTDWIEIEVNRTTLDNLSEWLTYRQSMRDLPSTIGTVVWKFDAQVPQLDFSAMDIPQRPRIIRKPTS